MFYFKSIQANNINNNRNDKINFIYHKTIGKKELQEYNETTLNGEGHQVNNSKYANYRTIIIKQIYKSLNIYMNFPIFKMPIDPSQMLEYCKIMINMVNKILV